MNEHRSRQEDVGGEELKPRSKRRFGSGPRDRKNQIGDEDFRAARRQRRSDPLDDLEFDEYEDFDDVDELSDPVDEDFDDFDDEEYSVSDNDDAIDWDRD